MSKDLLGTRPKKSKKNWKPLWGKRMGELTKMRQVWNRTKNHWVEMRHTLNVRANRVKLCNKQSRKLRATKNVFKVERCGSSLLTSNRKIEFGKKTVDF
jgi:hypothetical protein